jgi:streptogramin lyase
MGTASAERILDLWVARVREIVPAGLAFSYEAGPSVVLHVQKGRRRVPATAEHRLRRTYEPLAKLLQSTISDTDGKPWPAADAKPHVDIRADEVNVYWTAAGSTETIVRLAPISRAELGL